jgi:XTP/dITP diphosphohydrolase
MKKLLIATNNHGKIVELADLLRELPCELVTPASIGLDMDVDETGLTYEENARLKAAAFASASCLPALADDTGLEVLALGGAPGLHSKRYDPQPGANDADRRKLLIRNLTGFPHPWAARFVRTVAFAMPDGIVAVAHGTCQGEIIPEESGDYGFGYDSIFLFPEIGKTMAEIDLGQKNRISHRANAVHNILQSIKEAYS